MPVIPVAVHVRPREPGGPRLHAVERHDCDDCDDLHAAVEGVADRFARRHPDGTVLARGSLSLPARFAAAGRSWDEFTVRAVRHAKEETP
jgi:hypothetical protein